MKHFNVITIESSAFQSIIAEIKALRNEVSNFQKENSSPLSERWLDNQGVCQLLNISKRTLQYHKTSGLLPFSQISGKIYYKASDVEKLLEDNYTDTELGYSSF